MEWERIRKRPEDFAGANLRNYERCIGAFSWAQARALLDGLPGGGLNIAYEAVDRHVLAGRGNKLALRWIGRDDAIRDFSYAALRAQSNRFANVLAQHGIAKGDRVFALLGRCPELYVAALGTLKHGSVFSPLFSAFGPSRSKPGWRSAAPRFSLPPRRSTGAKSSPGATSFPALSSCCSPNARSNRFRQR